jgi:mannose-6-phosphate isomerase
MVIFIIIYGLGNNDTKFYLFFRHLHLTFYTFTKEIAQKSRSGAMKTQRIYKLHGVVQHYQWGGTDFLPNLLLKTNEKGEPWAEYWLGVHPKGTADVDTAHGLQSLAEILQDNPDFLGEKVIRAFGELPFLFKILDVKEMLSIQLHPTREVAEQRFAREEAAGIPLLADNRNYKDKNHKPEVMVALTDFWLLHGFQPKEFIEKSLAEIPGWADLLPVYATKGVPGLYERVMTATEEDIFLWLDPLYQALKERQAMLTPDQPDYWAWQAFLQYSEEGHHDRGIFSIYWFNLVHLVAGEGIFQDAGIPHAYLRGVNVELMANSDNVLRGGLTPKHIDVPELLDNINFSAVNPQILRGEVGQDRGHNYPVPVPDFTLKQYQLAEGETVLGKENGPRILLIISGEASLDEQIFQRGEAAFIPANYTLNCRNSGEQRLRFFVAGVSQYLNT